MFWQSHEMIEVNLPSSKLTITIPKLSIQENPDDYLLAIQDVVHKELGINKKIGITSETKQQFNFFIDMELLQKYTGITDIGFFKGQLSESLNSLLVRHIPEITAELKLLSNNELSIKFSNILPDSTEMSGLNLKQFHICYELLIFTCLNKEQKFGEINQKIIKNLAVQCEKLSSADLKNSEVVILDNLFNKVWRDPFDLVGFSDLELSTKLMLRDAVKLGISFELIDRQAQIVKLSLGDHIEYVKNTNMTSKDSYITPIIMENKTATKRVLQQHNFNVPKGKEFNNIEMAKDSFTNFVNIPIVIKPKTTNFGLGISIFEETYTQDMFDEALKIAFKEDDSILIEEFISGTEYRFYVLDGQVEGITLRIPANVEGDGVHTIEELVAIKNQDPLRGTHYRKPLQLLHLGAVELLMLKSQGSTPLTIPKSNEIIFLRENSNVSTGGDSIDFTDKMPNCYKEIAVEAVQALGAYVSGIDLMIDDYHKYTTKLDSGYGIIEANFNPAIHMHMFPFKGKSRPLAQKLLKKLFPEIESK
ncbi:bifunctional glutamate--cysteine ligase GshA/glutathione synthetase GshB [Vagococcus vulneris]|uniref:Bifunctional glutamate--cysteine ligase/glutathione synthetase n=2 Tax=Vagococcus vulneris TaxID=1977869 RepID=A0A430A244_9ENTE|nr:bifunctional glutamate--cysteine ligase/glutathione synthetase [Vagococcus vulneris]